jgi:hypothetical protein
MIHEYYVVSKEMPNLILRTLDKITQVKSMCLIIHSVIMTYGGGGVNLLLHAFSASAFDGGEGLASRSGQFPSRKTVPELSGF